MRYRNGASRLAITLNPQFYDGPECIAEFMIPDGEWAAGIAAQHMNECPIEIERDSGFSRATGEGKCGSMITVF